VDEADKRADEGLDGAAYRIWAKRNNIHRKRWADMTPEKVKHAKNQRRLVDDQVDDLERRDKTRWDR
jgi:hypothetical protein